MNAILCGRCYQQLGDLNAVTFYQAAHELEVRFGIVALDLLAEHGKLVTGARRHLKIIWVEMQWWESVISIVYRFFEV